MREQKARTRLVFWGCFATCFLFLFLFKNCCISRRFSAWGVGSSKHIKHPEDICRKNKKKHQEPQPQKSKNKKPKNKKKGTHAQTKKATLPLPARGLFPGHLSSFQVTWAC
jgi:hypothetical protein